MVSVYICWFCS